MEIFVPHAEAITLINEQIEKMKPWIERVKTGANFVNEMRTLRRNFDNWRMHNRDMLRLIFGPAKLQDYAKQTGDGDFFVPYDLLDELEMREQELAGDVAFLQACIEALPLYRQHAAATAILEAGKPFTAYSIATSLVKSATKSILLVDPYVNADTLGLLASKPAPVSIRILTDTSKVKASSLASAAKAFLAEHGGALSIRSTGSVHDRFLLVDEDRLFLSGASFKDLGKKTSALTPLEGFAKGAAVKALNDEWNAAALIFPSS